MANPFVHLELSTPDLPKAKEFYAKLFNWTITDNDMGGGMVYSMFKPDDGPGGGMFTKSGSPTGWLAYVGVDDIDAATKKAESLGASIVRGPHEVPGHGWMTVLTDPTGATIALWQATTA
jgi:predicted enzyme related to lactoylglutathione lyase